MKAYFVFGVMVFLLFLGADNTLAAMYCDNSLIMEGMTKLDVISRCGDPNLKEFSSTNSVGTYSIPNFQIQTSQVEVWHYNCGEGRLYISLSFEGSKLMSITRSGQYGSGKQRCN